MSDPTIKILHIMASGANGGAENAFIDIVEGLQDINGLKQMALIRGHAGREGRLDGAGIPYKTLPFAGGLDLWSRWQIKRAIQHWRPDIVQTWLSRAARNLPKKSAIENPPAGPLYISRLGGYYKIKNYRHTDYFIANTPDIRTYLMQHNVAEDRVTYIPNYAQTHQNPLQNPLPINRADFNTPDGAPLFLSASRLHPEKGIDIFLKALAQIPDAYGWIAGTGPAEVDLRALAADLKIQDRIRFLGWREDIGALARAADGFVLASRLEPFGNAFVNAWAANGAAVIASASQGPLQFIRDGADGLLFPIEDDTALAGHMQYIIKHPTQRAAMAKAGQKRAAEEFSKEACLNGYAAFYRRLYDAHRSMPASP